MSVYDPVTACPGRATPRPDQPRAAVPHVGTGPWQQYPGAAAGVLERLGRQVPMDLWLVTEVVGPTQTVLAAWGSWAGESGPGTSYAWSASLCRPMFEGRGPYVAPDVHAVPGYAQVAQAAHPQVRCYVGVPLLATDSGLLGTLCGFAGDVGPAALVDDLPTVLFCGQVLSTLLAAQALAGEQSRALTQAAALAERDADTGLLNDRGWQRALGYESERSSRYGAAASVLVLELDARRTRSGRDLRAAAADVLARTCRPSDLVASPAPQELAVLAVQCDAACARALAVRIRHGLRVADVPGTLGVATRRVGEDLHGTRQRAGQAMQAARDRRRGVRTD